METLLLLCKITGLIATLAFFISLVYTIISVFVQNIIKDIKGANQYVLLKKQYEELLEKVERLEIENIDKELNK